MVVSGTHTHGPQLEQHSARSHHLQYVTRPPAPPPGRESNLEVPRAAQQKGVHLPLGPGRGAFPAAALRGVTLHSDVTRARWARPEVKERRGAGGGLEALRAHHQHPGRPHEAGEEEREEEEGEEEKEKEKARWWW